MGIASRRCSVMTWGVSMHILLTNDLNNLTQRIKAKQAQREHNEMRPTLDNYRDDDLTLMKHE
jgi:hypothetical protein